MKSYPNYFALVARLALAAGMLSAVADRFGWWGPSGQPHVVWGNWAHFVAYTGQVNSFLPVGLAPILAVLATSVEIGLSICLLVGFKIRWAAFATAALMLIFALAMTVSFGPKPSLDYSVWGNFGCALLLAGAPGYRSSAEARRTA